MARSTKRSAAGADATPPVSEMPQAPETPEPEVEPTWVDTTQIVVPALPPAVDEGPKTVRVRAVVSVNDHLVGDEWSTTISDHLLAFVDRGWVEVVEIDGFRLP